MSELEGLLLLQIAEARLPEPVEQLRFAPPRRWRFDFAWPDAMLAVEVDGATWVQGRHTRGRGFQADCEKLNQAALLGWRVLRFTAEMVGDGSALRDIAAALDNHNNPKGVCEKCQSGR